MGRCWTVKDHVNKQNKGSHAFYSVGMWTCLAAVVLWFLGVFIVLFTCFSARKEKNSGDERDGLELTVRLDARVEKYSKNSMKSKRRDGPHTTMLISKIRQELRHVLKDAPSAPAIVIRGSLLNQ